MSKDEIKDLLRAMLKEVHTMDRDEAFESGFQHVKAIVDQGVNSLVLFQAIFELMIEIDSEQKVRTVKLHKDDLGKLVAEALEKHP